MNGNHAAVSKDPLTKQGSLEMESPSACEQQEQHASPLLFLQSLWSLIVAYALYYRGITSILLGAVFILFVVVSLDALASHVTSQKFHHLTQDYSRIPSLVELQMAQIDHWCLQGGDNHCTCNDPTEPTSREESRGWLKSHKSHKQQINSFPPNMNWDVVLLGDDFVESYAGTALGQPVSQLKSVAKYWDGTFSTEGGGDVEGLALGIAGDSISNLLWRIQHGGLPDSKVYWIHIGTNDFGRGQCSEEAVLLGILRLAEWIHQEFPDAVIVINSILPRKDVWKGKKKNKHASPEVVYSAIQEVNAQLESFCVHHDHLVYFDATPLFVNANLNKKKNNGGTLRNPMYDQDKFHLSLQGYKTWGNAILERLKLILYDDDESSN